MKIVHILADLYMGGAEKFCVDLCNALAKNPKNEVYLCILGKIDKDMILAEQIESNVKVITLNKIGKSPKVIFQLLKVLKEIKPDISHTHLRAQMYAVLPLILLKIPNIHTIHNMAQKEIGKKIRDFYKVLYKYFNFTPVSISDQVLESAKEEYGAHCNEVIYNGAKAVSKTEKYSEVKQFVDNLRKTEDTKIFLNIGRIIKQKNQLMLIEVCEELIVEGYDIHLVILGSLVTDKAYTQECQAAIKTPERIHVLGEKGNIGDYLYACDAFCLSSIYEGLPIVVLEAMSAGVPVLSTPAGGVPDVVIEQKSGLLCDGFSHESYKAILKNFMGNPSFDEEAIKELFEENYSMNITARNYNDLYIRKVKVDE